MKELKKIELHNLKMSFKALKFKKWNPRSWKWKRMELEGLSNDKTEPHNLELSSKIKKIETRRLGMKKNDT